MAQSNFTFAILFLVFLQVTYPNNVAAHQKTYPLKIKSSGTFISTSIDTDNDGLPASISMLEGKSRRFGRITSKIVTEAQLAIDENGNPVTCTTPDNKPGFLNKFVTARGVYNFKNGDQIFTQGETVNTCADVEACFSETGSVKAGCLFYGIAKGIITGGTGRFACASGMIEDSSTGFALVVDDKNQFFGAILESGVDGEITLDTDCLE